MKRIVSFVLAVAMSLALYLSFVSCGNSHNLAYGKKYIYEVGSSRREVLIFNKNGTGTYEYFNREKSYIGSIGYKTMSGTVSFIWEKTNDGAIHMFKTDVTYNEDHSEGNEIVLISRPLYFSKNMVYYSYVSGSEYGTSTYTCKYLLEGSKLYKEVYDKD